MKPIEVSGTKTRECLNENINELKQIVKSKLSETFMYIKA
jgi:hypothetical protein